MGATLGDRVRAAIAAKGLTQDEFIDQLAKELDAKRIAGSSAMSFYRYMNPESGRMPSGPWLETAAGLLGVRAAWLETGKGPRTDQEVIVKPDGARHGHRAGDGDITPDRPFGGDAIRAGAPRLTAYQRYDLDALLHMIVSKRFAVRREKFTAETLQQEAAKVEQAVLCSFDALGEQPDPAAVLQQLTAMLVRLDRQLDELFGPA